MESMGLYIVFFGSPHIAPLEPRSNLARTSTLDRPSVRRQPATRADVTLPARPWFLLSIGLPGLLPIGYFHLLTTQTTRQTTHQRPTQQTACNFHRLSTREPTIHPLTVKIPGFTRPAIAHSFLLVRPASTHDLAVSRVTSSPAYHPRVRPIAAAARSSTGDRRLSPSQT